MSQKTFTVNNAFFLEAEYQPVDDHIMNQLGGSSSSYGASDSTTLSLVADYQKKLARGNKVSTIK